MKNVSSVIRGLKPSVGLLFVTSLFSHSAFSADAISVNSPTNGSTIYSSTGTYSINTAVKTFTNIGGDVVKACLYLDGAAIYGGSSPDSQGVTSIALSKTTTDASHGLQVFGITVSTCPSTTPTSSIAIQSNVVTFTMATPTPTPTPTPAPAQFTMSCTGVTQGACALTDASTVCPATVTGIPVTATTTYHVQVMNPSQFATATACVYVYNPDSTACPSSSYKWQGDLVAYNGSKGDGVLADVVSLPTGVTGVHTPIQDCYRSIAVSWILSSDPSGIYSSALGWEYSGGTGSGNANNMLAAAQKVNYMSQWIYNNIHLSGGVLNPPAGYSSNPVGVNSGPGFCARGFSAGTSQVLFDLTHYGSGALFDHVQLDAATPFARLDLGCLASGQAIDTVETGPASQSYTAYSMSSSDLRLQPVLAKFPTTTTIDPRYAGTMTGSTLTSSYTNINSFPMFFVSSSTASFGGTHAAPTSSSTCGQDTTASAEQASLLSQSIIDNATFGASLGSSAITQHVNLPNTSVSAFICANANTNQTHGGARYVFGPNADQWVPGGASWNGALLAGSYLPGALSTNANYYAVGQPAGYGPGAAQMTTCNSTSCAPFVYAAQDCPATKGEAVSSGPNANAAIESDLVHNCIQRH